MSGSEDAARAFARSCFARDARGQEPRILGDADLDVACMAVCQNVVGAEQCAEDVRRTWSNDPGLRKQMCDGVHGFGAQNAAMSRITRAACDNGAPSSSTITAVPATDIAPLRHEARAYRVVERPALTVAAYAALAAVPFLIIFVIFVVHAGGPPGPPHVAAAPSPPASIRSTRV